VNEIGGFTMSFRAILLGALVLVASFIGATLLMNLLWPKGASTSAVLQQGRPALVAVPPLQPLSGSSTVAERRFDERCAAAGPAGAGRGAAVATFERVVDSPHPGGRRHDRDP
jgi:hypothetical protein